jgi:hypothetical protein
MQGTSGPGDVISSPTSTNFFDVQLNVNDATVHLVAPP